MMNAPEISGDLPRIHSILIGSVALPCVESRGVVEDISRSSNFL